MDEKGRDGASMIKNKIKELEDKIRQQQEELDKLNKKAKKTSFFLFWLLKDKF